MSVVVRFAPSPTGFLHIGNARAALVNWLFARKEGGKFMLRLDDTDKERSKQEYIDGLYKDLEWLGLDYDLFAKQSDRIDEYEAAKQQLIANGRLYACYETPDELEKKRRIQLAKGLPPVYDRSSLHATAEQIRAWEAEGRKPHWRFLLKEGMAEWADLLKGNLSFNPTHSLSDPVLVKADGTFLYTLSSIVDDIAFGITHIIRGEDHVTNTAVQVQLFEALGKNPNDVTFAHLALLVDQEGQPLSKRLNSFCLQNLQQAGIEPMALSCLIASLGSSIQPYFTYDLRDLAEHFDLTKIKGGARVDAQAIDAFHLRILHTLPYAEAKKRAEDFSLSEAEWDIVRDSLDHFEDYALWDAILHDAETRFSSLLPAEDGDYIQAAAQAFPEGPISESTWSAWTSALKQQNQRSGRDIAHPLRVALTGKEKGPEMKQLLPFLTRELILARLSK